MTKNLYRKTARRRMLYLSLLAAGAVITFFIDICTGPANLGLSDIARFFFSGQSDPIKRIIIWDLRLPIALMGIFAGSALAIAGAEIQTVLDNPIACSYSMGISAAAGFGAALVLVRGVGSLVIGEDILVSIAAFIFAMLDCIVIYILSRIRGISKGMILLLGIALMFTFNSLLGFIEYYSSTDVLQAIVYWLFGSLSKATWSRVGILAAVSFIIVILFALDAWKLTALRLGDEKAKSMGIDVKRLILKTLILTSVLASVVSSFVGIIGFVGLVAPHISRMLVGEDQRYFIFGSAFAGAFLLSGADILSKVLINGAVLPIGIVTSFIGVPFFMYLILRKKKAL
jgi:iron complex transport system permease protein